MKNNSFAMCININVKAQRSIFLQLLLTFFIHYVSSTKTDQPNIVFILADDLGWYDVGFHGSDLSTPNIDRLAREGVVLDNYYVQPLCTPTRGALMTGRYPIHLGLQHYVIAGCEPYGLPLNHTTIAQHLRRLNYRTYAIGKWHLGFFKKEYLPESRGFDHHFGYYVGLTDYFDHYAHDGGYIGYDFHRNGKTVWNLTEKYSTDLYTEEAERIIRDHNQSKPLFLYLAQQAVHVGNHEDPIEVPQTYIDRFPHIKNQKRRFYAGVTSALDDSVGRVYQALQDSGLADNTILVFSTDNGGTPNGYDGNAGCNWPLRGCKHTLWEGGVRGVGFVHSPLLHKTKSHRHTGLVHVTDWLPTLYARAGGDVSDLGPMDGVNQWDAISRQQPSARKEILLNIDPIDRQEGIIVGDFKYIKGEQLNYFSGWYPPPDSRQDAVANTSIHYADNWIASRPNLNVSTVVVTHDRRVEDLIQFINAQYEGIRKSLSHHFYQNVQNRNKRSINYRDETRLSNRERSGKETAEISLLVNCGQKPENASRNCQPGKKACLFHLRDDPCEYYNLADDLPHVVEALRERIARYNSTMVPPGNKPSDPRGNPQLHGGVWQPWM